METGKEKPGHPLLLTLAWVSSRFGRARSLNALSDGLPIDENHGMTPDLFCSAADRIGITAAIVRREIKKIPAQILPVVLLMKDGNACVLLSFEGRKQMRIWQPDSDQEVTVDRKELEKIYDGHAIFLRPHETTVTVEGEPEHHWFWSTIADNRTIYMQVMVAAVLLNLFALAGPLFLMNIYDRVLPNQAIETGWALGIGAILVFVFDFMIRNLRAYFIDIAGRRIDVILARRIFDHVLDMKLAHRNRSTGAFANNLREFEAVRDFFTSATLTAFVDFPFALLFLFVIWLFAPAVAGLLVVIFAVTLVFVAFLQPAVQNLVRKSMHSAEAKHGLLVETLHGLETVKATGGSGRFRARYGDFVGESALWGQKSRFLSGLGMHAAMFAQQVSGILIVLSGMYLVQDRELSVGALIACVILGSRVLGPLGQVAMLVTRYHQAMTGYASLDRIMKTPVERPAGQSFLHRPDFEGKIDFRGVAFTYPGQKHRTLEQINFHISAGEKVGIIGRIGSGKSTLTKLLLNFYEPDSGHVMIDGTDVRQIDPADMRRNIAYIAQDTMLFSGTIRDNIILSKPDASEEDILQAARLSGVEEFVRRHPMGYDAPVGESGMGLSGGQRQAITFARAILSTPSILVADEPTSAMDSQSEQAFMRYVQEYCKNRTFILVTHKPGLLQMVDRLMLMENGRLVIDGPRDKVLEALASGKVSVPMAKAG